MRPLYFFFFSLFLPPIVALQEEKKKRKIALGRLGIIKPIGKLLGCSGSGMDNAAVYDYHTYCAVA